LKYAEGYEAMNASTWNESGKNRGQGRGRPAPAAEKVNFSFQNIGIQSTYDLYGVTRNALERMLKIGISRALGTLNVPGAVEMAHLEAQITKLEQQLKGLQIKNSNEVSGLRQSLRASEGTLNGMFADYERMSALAVLASVVPGIAHDLNTPISNANLVTESLEEDLRNFATLVDSGELRKSDLLKFLAQAQEAMAILRSAGRQSTELVGSLKQFAVDSVSSRQRSFGLGPLVDDVLRTLKPTLRGKSIQIELHIDPNLTLVSYPGALSQILINLIQNAAIHAFPNNQGGTVRLSAVALPGDRVQIELMDSGVGMGREVLAQLFTPFFTTRGNQGGSGVGLSHSLKLATQVLGGQLTAQSAVGHGACFTLDLPLNAPEHASAP
jgi:signal transduction histidine kinase